MKNISGIVFALFAFVSTNAFGQGQVLNVKPYCPAPTTTSAPAPAPAKTGGGKKRAPAAPAVPPTCMAVDATVTSDAGKPAMNAIRCTGDVKQIAQVITTCGDDCNLGGVTSHLRTEPAAAPVGNILTHPVAVGWNNPRKPGRSNVTVEMITKTGGRIPVQYGVDWKVSPCVTSGGTLDSNGNCGNCPEGKEPSADKLTCVDKVKPSAAELACTESAPGKAKWVVDAKGVGTCICTPPLVEGKNGNFMVCRDPAIPPTINKSETTNNYFGSSPIHLKLKLDGSGYKAGNFSSGFGGFASVGISWEAIPKFLEPYVFFGLGMPGARAVDSKGNIQNRQMSAKIEGGMLLWLHPNFGLKGGVQTVAFGLVNGDQYIHSLLGGVFGLEGRAILSKNVALEGGVDAMVGSFSTRKTVGGASSNTDTGYGGGLHVGLSFIGY